MHDSCPHCQGPLPVDSRPTAVSRPVFWICLAIAIAAMGGAALWAAFFLQTEVHKARMAELSARNQANMIRLKSLARDQVLARDFSIEAQRSKNLQSDLLDLKSESEQLQEENRALKRQVEELERRITELRQTVPN